MMSFILIIIVFHSKDCLLTLFIESCSVILVFIEINYFTNFDKANLVVLIS